jgi:hypothetical protein
MTTKPWISGPKELLEHGLDHLQKPTNFDARIAMISIDNAVELIIKVYLGLPQRATGIHVPRKELEETTNSFPSLLNALEKFAPSKISGVDLAEIEWFHRLRNELYHQGNGITVEREKVQVYASIAKTLMHNLFAVPLQELSDRPADESLALISQFFDYWEETNDVLNSLVRLYLQGPQSYSGDLFVGMLCEADILPESFVHDYDLVSEYRHGLSRRKTIPTINEWKNQVGILRNLYAIAEEAEIGR